MRLSEPDGDEGKSGFEQECRRVFGQLMGHGRQWRPAAMEKLSLSKATFYRYCSGSTSVAPRIWKTLDQLAREHQGVPTDVPMAPLIARALVDLQEEMDHDGGFGGGLPESALTLFDIGSARNIQNNESWPVDLPGLFAWAGNPPAEFVNTYDDVLLEFGTVTDLCVSLAAGHRSGDAASEERVYEDLRNLCKENAAHSQALYVAIRGFAIREPLARRTDIERKLSLPAVVHSIAAAFLKDKCYEALSGSMGVPGKGVPACTLTGVPLRQTGTPGCFTSECRIPHAVQSAKEGVCRWRTEMGLWVLKRHLRVYWAYPGQAEMALYEGLVVRGWECELWPNMDTADIRATSPDRQVRIVVDVKDTSNAASLAAPRAWAGLTAYVGHTPFLVVPDYRTERNPGYRAAFTRAMRGSGFEVNLVTVSELLKKVDAGL